MPVVQLNSVIGCIRVICVIFSLSLLCFSVAAGILYQHIYTELS